MMNLLGKLKFILARSVLLVSCILSIDHAAASYFSQLNITQEMRADLEFLLEQFETMYESAVSDEERVAAVSYLNHSVNEILNEISITNSQSPLANRLLTEETESSQTRYNQDNFGEFSPPPPTVAQTNLQKMLAYQKIKPLLDGQKSFTEEEILQIKAGLRLLKSRPVEGASSCSTSGHCQLKSFQIQLNETQIEELLNAISQLYRKDVAVKIKRDGLPVEVLAFKEVTSDHESIGQKKSNNVAKQTSPPFANAGLRNLGGREYSYHDNTKAQQLKPRGVFFKMAGVMLAPIGVGSALGTLAGILGGEATNGFILGTFLLGPVFEFASLPITLPVCKEMLRAYGRQEKNKKSPRVENTRAGLINTSVRFEFERAV